MDYELALSKDNKLYIKTNLTGYALLANPLLNKGMAFPRSEREEFGLQGLIPPHETTLETQIARSYETLESKSTDLEKYIYLRDLQDSNETVFYSLLCNHITELMPIVYTPVVGLGCQRYSHIYRRPRGIYISYPDAAEIDKILAHPRFDKIKVIVVSDGERILGLGDQGAGGMGIPIGKLALYTACAGIHPSTALPILLDTGTNNEDLLNDPLYVGWHHKRVRGKEYDDFLAAFVAGVKKRLPHVLLQWEDFAQQNANPILERYRDKLCTFNDDIQGTAAVAVGTLLAAIKVTGTPLCDQRIAVVGAGSAGCGISNLIMHAMIEEGLSVEDAAQRFYLIDRNGLLTSDMPELLPFQKPFAQDRNNLITWNFSNPNSISLKDVVTYAKPTLLIGVSGQAGIFTEEIIKIMAKNVERPVIFPLSNPTTQSEATPSDLMKWTNEKAVIGTGSPFAPILKSGNLFRVDQTNNCYIFPGIGLGLIAVKSKFVTDKMFMIAAIALAECSPARSNPKENLLPPLAEIRQVSFKVACAVAQEAIAAGLGKLPDGVTLEQQILNKMWEPNYLPYKKS
ncbi:MAG: NAD-dependent malic enzyme [Gammaproteobacteria bacterium]|nr:NAD-dependent malic enzyme [Gammaproteobacteria bacterium]